MAAPRRAPKGYDDGAIRPPDYYLSDPFGDWDAHQMAREIQKFIKKTGLEDYETYIRKGAILNHDFNAFEGEDRPDGLELKDEEKRYLKLERSSIKIDKFKQAGHLWVLVGLCSLGAAVQGWDESAVNGAQIYYQYAFPALADHGRLGLVNSAPYLCCTASCLLTYPLNKYLGRRGTILLTCLISSLACLGQAFPQTWTQLFAARFLLGFGIGPKSATIPIYAAECAPANVRGALVMMWQMWTAFGIMCGYIAGVVLQNATSGILDLQNGNQCTGNVGQSRGSLTCDQHSDPSVLRTLHCSLNWRLMLASPMILPLVVVCYIYTLPESPRWLLSQAHKGSKHSRYYYEKAFNSLCKLRHTKLQAARDLFLINHQLLEETRLRKQSKPFTELFTKPRNRRALLASCSTMFFQQFSGVNVMAYYSSQIFLQSGLPIGNALTASMGFGIINFLFALPAVWTIDSFGRRSLLLTCFPFMAASQLILSIAFATTSSCTRVQRALVLVGMYLFAIFYSPSEGPVPFVYSAESMPLYNRDLGMGIVTAVNWFFNFFLAITWPPFVAAFKSFGAFLFYAAWCVIAEIVILLIVPETKDLTLEQLAQVFDIPTREHAAFGIRQASWFFRRYIFHSNPGDAPVLIRRGPPEAQIPDVVHGLPVMDEKGAATVQRVETRNDSSSPRPRGGSGAVTGSYGGYGADLDTIETVNH